MKRILPFCLLLVLASCTPQEPEVPCVISYEVLVTDIQNAEFSVTYQDGNGTDHYLGIIEGDYWYKGELEGFERGDKVYLQVDNEGPAASYRLRAKKNGILLDQKKQLLTNGSLRIEVEIPVY